MRVKRHVRMHRLEMLMVELRSRQLSYKLQQKVSPRSLVGKQPLAESKSAGG